MYVGVHNIWLNSASQADNGFVKLGLFKLHFAKENRLDVLV
jgi:hypothetical protein